MAFFPGTTARTSKGTNLHHIIIVFGNFDTNFNRIIEDAHSN